MFWLPFQGSYSEFCNQDKNLPGTLIEVLQYGKKKQFMIGDINPVGSSQDGLLLLLPSTQVLRYQIIWYRWPGN